MRKYFGCLQTLHSTYNRVHAFTELGTELLHDSLVDDVGTHTTIQAGKHKSLAVVVLKSKRTSLQTQMNAGATLTGDGVAHKIDFHARPSDVIDACGEKKIILAQTINKTTGKVLPVPTL